MRTGNPTEWGYLAKVLSRSDSLVEPCNTGEFVRGTVFQLVRNL